MHAGAGLFRIGVFLGDDSNTKGSCVAGGISERVCCGSIIVVERLIPCLRVMSHCQRTATTQGWFAQYQSHRASDPLVLASSDHEKEHHEQSAGYKPDPCKGERSVHFSTGTLHCLLDNACKMCVSQELGVFSLGIDNGWRSYGAIRDRNRPARVRYRAGLGSCRLSGCPWSRALSKLLPLQVLSRISAYLLALTNHKV